jgi:predicted transcriptional regulator
MANHRTTILLDDESRRAAKQLATALDVPPSEAVRRAIVAYRDQIVGVSADVRKKRVLAFTRARDLFEGNDAEAEVRSLKEQDKYF